MIGGEVVEEAPGIVRTVRMSIELTLRVLLEVVPKEMPLGRPIGIVQQSGSSFGPGLEIRDEAYLVLREIGDVQEILKPGWIATESWMV
jgi:hypothetical protein